MNENLKFWFALNKVPGLGPVRLKKLLEQYSSAQAVCAALNCPVPGIEDDLLKLDRAGARVIAIEEEAYPLSLKNIHDPPPLLYIRGDLLTEDAGSVAIVGTRRPTAYGLAVAGQLAFELARRGLTVVSGLALGIDAAAHEGALRADGRTIAVLGSGIDRIAPLTNLALAERIVRHGAVVTEYPLGQEPDKWTFPQRNRIIAGLSLGVIVVEGHYESGAMITAKQALEQGREVFAVPGNVGLEQSKGPHWLIKQGAKLVETVDDVLEELKFQIPNDKLCAKGASASGGQTKIKPANLSPEEEKIFSLLSGEPKQLDALACEADWPVQQVAACLTLLEIKKLVEQAGYQPDRIRIDQTIVRGLEYYTGPVYEIELLLDTNDDKGRPVRFGSVGGGGRYDGLVSRFRGEPVPAAGFSIGVSRLQAALSLLGKLEAKQEFGPVVVTVFDKARVADYQAMVAKLRRAGIRAELYLGSGKMGPQLKYADKRNSPCVVIQGGDEKQKGEVQIKDLIQGAKAAAANCAGRLSRHS